MNSFVNKNKGILILLAIIAVITLFCGFLPKWQYTVLGIPPAVSPVIQLPGENLIGPVLDFPGEVYDIYITNTLVATWLTYLLLIVLAIIARAGLREVPGGLANLLELAVEALYGIAEGVVGSKWARRIFPIAATVFLLILFANWMEMIPGVDSVGVLHHAEGSHEGYPAKEVSFIPGVFYLDTTHDALPAETHADEGDHGEEEASEEEGHETAEMDLAGPYIVTPFVRTASTDINFPLGLAIVTFLAVQGFGIAALGTHYIAKFINTPALARGGMGLMDFGVGLLELILEPVKMVSLTFRLLGNIFGGAVLLFVLSGLVPYLLPTGLYLYELFVGAIQAYVFFMLTLVYANVAMTGHGGEEEHH